ncbi:MAG: uncharacterized protein JWP97_4751 [Labilithrix sp.]|nr:uncharacterized protein [Labilithrix sp.]
MTGSPEPVWQGVFASFAEAGGESSVFEGSIWLDKIVERARAAMSGTGEGAIPPVAVTSEYALPFIAASLARRGTPLRILDFGGGMATSYVPLRAMLPPQQSLEFVVVENGPIGDAGRALFAASPEVSFRTDLPDRGPFDIVHFGSSLHYVDDWKGLLERIASLGPASLLFADLTAGDNRTFVTTQRFHDRRIPVRFWNVDEFVDVVSALGFELAMKARYRGYYLGVEQELPTANFDVEHRLTYTSQLVFRSATKQ